MFKNCWRLLPVLALLLTACGKPEANPTIFLPTVLGPEGSDLSALHAKYCTGVNFDLNQDFLTEENFYSIFNCANYDRSLEDLRPLFTHRQFPDFLRNMNTILRSNETKDLKETLKSWLAEGPEGTSRIDRLLPILARIIKNASFQQALPVINNILMAGEQVWNELLPQLADVIWQPRFEDNISDMMTLFRSSPSEARREKKDHAKFVKDWARFLKKDVDGKTVSRRAIELADGIRDIELPGTSLSAVLDHMNVKSVFVSLYQHNGKVRGEVINPKLNADPEPDELVQGLNLTPEERQERARRKLFARGPNGEQAPIVQLAAMIAELHKPHQNFLPSVSRWFAANGPKLSNGLSDYVTKALIRTNLTKVNLESFLTEFAQKDGGSVSRQVTAEEFVAFLATAIVSEDYSRWTETSLHAANREQFGEKNARLISRSALKADVLEIYKKPEVSNFGSTIIPPGKRLALVNAIKRFSNLHRSDKLKLEFRGKTQNLELHLIDIWLSAAQESLGESVVVDFVIQLAQTLFSDFANEFANKNQTLAEWYFASPYGSPSSTESIAGYAFKELDLMPKYEEHKEYLKGELANELFPGDAGADDRRAFRLLVDQIPNIWLYIKSGMARSGTDLNRALALPDQGFLSRNYVALIAKASETGWIKRGVRLLEAMHEHFPAKNVAPEPPTDLLEEARRVKKGVSALERVMSSLLEPEVTGDYETSTLRRLLKPLGVIVSPARRDDTERFLLTAADDLLSTPDKKINDFFDDLSKESGGDDQAAQVKRRETMRSVAELLKRENFPDVVRQLSRFFQDDAIKPALDFLARKIDDGTLPRVLLFIRRVLGFGN